MKLADLVLLSAYAILAGLFIWHCHAMVAYEADRYSASPLELRDFANYWIAGKAWSDGALPGIFRQESFVALLREQFGQGYPWHNWSYPPHFLFFCVPLYWLPYAASAATFIAGTFALFVLAARLYVLGLAPDRHEARRIWRSPLFLLPVATACLVNLLFLQNGFLVSALFLAALACWHDRPLLCGALLGLLTVKFQLGVLLPVFLLIDRNWLAIGCAIVATALLVALSTVAFGAQSWIDYVTVTLPYQSRVMHFLDGHFLAMLMSPFGAARLHDVALSAAWILQICLALPAVWLAIAIWRAQTDPLIRFAALAIATFVAVPYVTNYDAGILAVACAAAAFRYRDNIDIMPSGRMPPHPVQAELCHRVLLLVPALPVAAYLFGFYGDLQPAAPILLATLFAMSPYCRSLIGALPLNLSRPGSPAAS